MTGTRSYGARRISMALAFGLLCGAGCTLAVPLGEFESALRSDEVQTVIFEPGFTLYSPYGPKRSDALARDVRVNLAAVEAAFGVSFDEPIRVIAVPLELKGFETEHRDGTFTVRGALNSPTHRGIGGFTARPSDSDRPTMVIFVAKDRERTLPDGRVITETFRFNVEPIIRHEAAHLFAARALLDGVTWFSEGMALEIENMTLEDGALRPKPLPLTLQVARKNHRRWSLASVVDWEEQGARISEGEEEPFWMGRPLAHALMRFLLERHQKAPLPEQFRAVRAMSRQEILALEPEWRRWLDALPAGSEGE